MRRDWTRREFLTQAAASATSLAFAGTAGSVEAQAGESSAMRGRFLTHVSVVRVNQIEVTPDRSIGEDESSDNRPDRIRSRREAFAAGCPDGRMTWAISWLALKDGRKEYQAARRLLASYHDRFGDEITFIPGGYFAPMYDTRERQPADDTQCAKPNIRNGRERLPPPMPCSGLHGRRESATPRRR
ncbi:DUF3863 domain-containing protein [Tunturiibacter empetritectus]